MRLSKIHIISMILIITKIFAYATFHSQFLAAANLNSDDTQTGSYKLGFVPAGAQLTFQIKINTVNTVASQLEVKVVTTTIGLTGTLITAVATSDKSILQAKYTALTSQHHHLRVGKQVSVVDDYARIIYVSAFIKIGTVTPIITPIFQNYVDILRRRIIKLVYFKENQILNATILINTGNPPDQAFESRAVDQADTTNFKLNLVNNAKTNGASANPRTFEMVYPKGYNFIRFGSANSILNRVTYQSDPYPCPFPNTYTDIFQCFPGCYYSSQSQPATFPCITLTNGTCTYCYFGYVLVNSLCTYNPCNSDEYYLNLTCLKANPSCKEFDRFSGVCLTCVNSNYTLINGNCIVNACPSGYTNRNNTCVNIYCSNFILISGVCLSCINNAFELSNGSCVPVKCFAPNLYFSFNVQSCVSLPAYCTQLNFISQKCTACLSPLVLNSTTSICELICTLPQVKWQDQCVNLPQNCDQININRHCSKCKPNFDIISGVCQPTGVVIINNP